MPNYTKLFSCIVTSTIWTEDDSTRIVWITMLAIADKNGEVHASIPGLARVAGVTVEACRKAIAAFLAPDPDSRTPDHAGRRIAEIPGGWELLNHAKYRILASTADNKAANASRQRRHRERNGAVTRRNGSVTPASRTVTENTRKAEAEADVLLEKEPKARTRANGRDDDFDEACSVILDLTCSAQLKAAWHEWQTYRQQRHKASGSKRLAWTSQAARLSASSIAKAAADHGDQIVSDRIAAAVAGQWQGLNLDKITLPTNGRATKPLSRMEQIEIHSVDLI